MRGTLLSLFLCAPLLAGCATPAPAGLEGFDATFTGTAGTLHVRLEPGPPVADRFGALRPAHALRLAWQGSDGSHHNDTVRVDGAGVPVRFDAACPSGDCRYALADWSALGLLPPLGLWLPGRSTVEYVVDGVPLHQTLTPQSEDGLLRLDVAGDHRYLTQRYLALPGTFWFDAADAAVPVRLHTLLSATGPLVWLNRTAHTALGVLPDIPAWPLPAPPGQPVARPTSLAADQDAAPFDAPWPPPTRALSALLDADPASRQALAGGCILRFAQQRTPGHPEDNATSTTILLQADNGTLREVRLQGDGPDAPLRVAKATTPALGWASCKSGSWPAAPAVTLGEFADAAQQAPVSASGPVNAWSVLRVFSGTGRLDTPPRSLELFIASFTPAWVDLGGGSVAYAPYNLLADTADGSWLEAILHPGDLGRIDAGLLPRIAGGA